MMENYNILILSAGRRVELVQSFQRAAKKLKIKSNIVAGDCSATAPALYFADKRYLLPRISEPDYIDAIVAISNHEKIDLVVPTIDTDLLLLAHKKDYIEGKTSAKVLISAPHIIEICRDKLKTQHFLEEGGFGVPKMYTWEEINKGEPCYPLFVKPRSGSSSIDAFKVDSLAELKTYMSIVDKPLIQEFVEGEEYTVDVFLDFAGDVITIVPRLRISTRGGEISKGRIVKDREIINSVGKLMGDLRPIGHITVQLIKTGRGLKYIEINPRFGGGAPMSIKSGADSCENIYRLLMNEQLTYNENYKEKLTFLRFDNSICLDENLELIDDKSGNI